MSDRYGVNSAMIGGDGTGDTAITIHTQAALTYADTDEHTLETAPEELTYYKNIKFRIPVTYTGNPNDVNLTIGVATSDIELTGAQALAQFSSDFWTTKIIDLNTSGGTSTFQELLEIDASEINGQYVYTKYQYSGDPGNDPSVGVILSKV